MDQRLIALKLFLDHLEVPADIDTVHDRKRFQKAVYLGQLTGFDLGYRFSWYLKGPYSPVLAKDYFGLAEAIAIGDRGFEASELKDTYRDKLDVVKPLFAVPPDVALAQEDWLELLSSVHYLRKVSGKDREQMLDILRRSKPHLVNHVEQAETKLNNPALPPNLRL